MNTIIFWKSQNRFRFDFFQSIRQFFTGSVRGSTTASHRMSRGIVRITRRGNIFQSFLQGKWCLLSQIG
jgi:hypothetical protein